MRDRDPARPIVLASASPRRLDLLAQIGFTPDLIIAPEIDETPRSHEQPVAYAERLARAKARAAWPRCPPGALILAADTVVALGRRILPKAEEESCARACLAMISGRRHRVITAIVLARADAHCAGRVVESVVAFARLTTRQTDALIEAGDWRGKAGGYAVQGRAASHIRFLSGSYSNVVGLPLFETAQLLRSQGAMV